MAMQRRPLIMLSALLAVSAIAFIGGTIYAGSPLKFWVDPDAGRTRQEIEQAQHDASVSFWDRLPQWIQDENAKGLDPRTLPRAAMLVTVAAPPPTLAEATRLATLVVDGRITSLGFRPTGDTVVTVSVISTMKGPSAKQVQVIFPGGLRPVPDWDHVTLAYVEEAPLPMPGDHVVLFLQPSPTNASELNPQIGTGAYQVDEAGLVVPLDANPFAATLSGLDVGALSRAVSAVSK